MKNVSKKSLIHNTRIKNRQNTSSSIYNKIFNDPRISRSVPLLVIIELGAIIFCFLVVALLPSELTNTIVGIEIPYLIAPILVLLTIIGLRFIFKDSMFFKISTLIVMPCLVIAIYSYTLGIAGASIGNIIIICGSAIVILFTFTLYCVNLIEKPITTVMNDMKNARQGEFKRTSIDLSIYGKEFADLESSIIVLFEHLEQNFETSQTLSATLSSSSEELASTTEEVNALSEEIAATIQQISRGSTKQSDLAIKAMEEVSNMSNIVDQSLNDVETTLRVIEDIAGQTNILALNAAIEAARAGEFGRGFAVVADNVRRLAEETKSNSTEISKVTEQIVINIGSSVSSLQETLQGFAAQSEEFSASSEEVAAATEEQTAAMNQLTSLAQELTQPAEELSRVILSLKAE